MKKFILFLLFCTALSGLMIWNWGKEGFLKGQQFSRGDLKFSIILVDRNGQEMYRSFDRENREWTPLSAINPTLQKATILAEDRRFYNHFGVDPIGITRAMVKNFQSGHIVEGGSTLTQQVAKKTFLTDQKTFSRKFKELFIALGIESKNSKPKILEMYLNVVPYGPRVNGVEVASQVYFHKKPAELTDAESIVLAFLPRDPVDLSKTTRIRDLLGACSGESYFCTPFVDPQYQYSVLEKLLFELAEQEGWSLQKKEKVWFELARMEFNPPQNWVHADFQHFRFYVQDFLDKKHYDLSKVKDGVRIKTTLDMDLQKEILNYIRDGRAGELFEKRNIENISVAILDHESRGPIVWIGSKAYWNSAIDGQVDMLRSERQVGSSIKPFIYAAAIDNGYQPPTVLYDLPIYFNGSRKIIRNADLQYMGALRMTDALVKSRNVPAVKALLLAGGEHKVRDYLDQNYAFEINNRYQDHYFGWTMALGTTPIKLIDLVNGYATLATTENKELCPILKMETLSGEKLPSPCNALPRSKIADSTSFFVGDMLSDIEARPEFYKWRETLTLENGKNIAVKTGTSTKIVGNDVLPADNIVVGFSPKATVFVWGGNADGRALKPYSVALVSIGDLWKGIATKFFEKYPEKHDTFVSKEPLQKIHGEWATLDYAPPSYEPISGRLAQYHEWRVNPFVKIR